MPDGPTPARGADADDEPAYRRRARAKIVEAAVRELTENGAATFSVEGVVRRAGAGKATVYRHFPAGRDSLVAVLEVALAFEARPDVISPR